MRVDSHRSSCKALGAAVAVLFAMALGAGCATTQVVRVNDGRAYSERSIDPRAYAAYARARIHESEGDAAGAAQEYHRVLEFDDRAAQAWIRLGALGCQSEPVNADIAWRRATELDPSSWQLWLERARCALAGGQLELADSYGREALQYGPSRPEVTLLSALIASKLHDHDREARLLLGAVARQPTHAQLWSAIASSPTMPIALRRYAAWQLARLRPVDAAWIPPAHVHRAHPSPSQAGTAKRLSDEFEQALALHNASDTRRIAVLLGINPTELASEALAWGFYSLAAEQARKLLAIDPDDASAWLVALLAADISGNSRELDELLGHLPKHTTNLDAGLLASFLDLVRRRTSLLAEGD